MEPEFINPSNQDRRVERVLQALKQEYVVVGKTRVRAWHAWLLIGVAAGIAAGVILVANRSGEVDPSRAAEFDQATEEDYLFSPAISLASKNFPEEQAASAGRERILELIRKIPLASSATRPPLVAELSQRLRDRKKLLATLIEKDPNGAYASLLPHSIIAALPPEVRSDAETPILLTGKLETIHIDKNFPARASNTANPQSEFRYFLRSGGVHYELLPVGAELNAASGATVRVNGYQLASSLLAPIGVNGIEVTAAAPKLDSLGEQKVLAVLVNFQDSGPVPFTAAGAQKLIFNDSVQAYYKEASYGQMWWSGDVVDWITLPRSGMVNGVCVLPDLINDGLGELLASTYDLHQYRYITLFTNHLCMGGGQSYVSALDRIINGITYHFVESWVNALLAQDYEDWYPTVGWGSFDYVLAHEWGHALGVMHANSWECGTSILYGNCRHQEYGNWYDNMASPGFSIHFNGFFKDALGWLSGSILSITKSGTYTISPLELASGTRAAKIQPPGFTSPQFYLEFRQPIGFDSILSWPELANRWGTPIAYNGLFVNWNPTSPGDSPMSRLLDLAPHNDKQTSVNDWTNVVLAMQKFPFRDFATGITIGPVLSADDSKVTFRVSIGNPHCVRQNPVITLPAPGKNIDAAAGDIIDISTMFQNMDSAFCGSSPFFTTVATPPGWTSTFFTQNPVTLSPHGGTGYQAIELKISDTAPAGSYVAKVTVRNTKSFRSAEVKLSVNVK